MLLRRLFGSPSNANFLKGTLIWRGLAITSTDDEDDFFGITANDFYKSKSFQSSSPSNNDDFSKEAILTKHISNDVRKNDLEKYICTKFGKIRFDWQNIPSKGGEIFSHKIKLKKESNRSDSNTDYFEPSSREISPSSSTVVNAHTVEIRNNNSEVNNTDINSQYFGNYRENISNDTQKQTQNPSFSDTDSVDLEEKFSHQNFQHFDSKKKSEIDLTNDNFIESQYFHNFTNNSQVKSDSNASKNIHKHLSDSADNINFTESYFRTNSFVFPNTESSQNKEDKECVSKHNFTQNRNNPQNAFEVSQKIRSEMKRENKGKFFFILQKKKKLFSFFSFSK